MMTPEPPRRRLRGLAAAATMAVAMLAPASVLANDQVNAEIAPGEDPAMTQAALSDLRGQLDQMTVENDALRADNSTLQVTVDTLASERDRLQAALGRFDDLYGPIEADRQLLLELRKDLPETRPEVEAQLGRLRTLALSSDPARLGQFVDRVEEAAPAFLEWRFTDHVTPQAASEAYFSSGAGAFDTSLEALRSEVLLAAASRLDGLLTILDRVR